MLDLASPAPKGNPLGGSFFMLYLLAYACSLEAEHREHPGLHGTNIIS